MRKKPEAPSETPAELRSRTMRAVKAKDTGPELIVRRLLHAAGLRYRLHDARLPGKPDLVFSSRRIALFIHGCFWHQHAHCPAAARPKSNPEYWNRKLDGNAARDVRHRTALEADGWTVVVIWECETAVPSCLTNLKARILAADRGTYLAKAMPGSNTDNGSA